MKTEFPAHPMDALDEFTTATAPYRHSIETIEAAWRKHPDDHAEFEDAAFPIGDMPMRPVPLLCESAYQIRMEAHRLLKEVGEWWENHKERHGCMPPTSTAADQEASDVSG